MRWNHTNKPGDKRFVKRFALLPLRCRDNSWIWLEWFYKEQLYLISYPVLNWGDTDFGRLTTEQFMAKKLNGEV